MWGHYPTQWDKLCWSIPMLVPQAQGLMCVCVRTRVQGCLCAEGDLFHCCLRVEQPMAGMGVLLRTPWEELWWASVSNAHVDACL